MQTLARPNSAASPNPIYRSREHFYTYIYIIRDPKSRDPGIRDTEQYVGEIRTFLAETRNLTIENETQFDGN